MFNNNKKPAFKLPINIDIKDTYDKKVLEFVPNRINEGEAIIVNTKRYLGLSHKKFVVQHVNGTINIIPIE